MPVLPSPLRQFQAGCVARGQLCGRRASLVPVGRRRRREAAPESGIVWTSLHHWWKLGTMLTDAESCSKAAPMMPSEWTRQGAASACWPSPAPLSSAAVRHNFFVTSSHSPHAS